jgi:hypothetical protein
VCNIGEDTDHAIATRSAGPGGANSEVSNNTFCNLASYSVEVEDGLIVQDNVGIPGGAPQAACDAEVARILEEMQGLPGYPGTGDLDGDGQVTLADLRLLVRMLLGQAVPNVEAKGLAAPADQLTLGDVRVLMGMLTGG